MMNRNTLSLISAVMTAGLLTGATVAQAATVKTTFSIPVVELNNPCTPANDSIDGSLDLRAAAQFEADGVTWLRVGVSGSGADANGLAYNFGGSARLQYHDPLPAQLVIKLRMTGQTAIDNARADLRLHVNEQGTITQAEFSGVECLG